MTYKEFKSEVQHLNHSRKHKITTSIGVYSAYKWIRKNKWLNIGRPLTEHEFYSIIRGVNNYLADNLVKGKDIVLPERMGRLELRKYEARISFDGKKVVNNLPIDWDKTLRLWYEDKEAFQNKTLVKINEKDIFKVYYNRHLAKYNNQAFYEFKLNRDLKTRLKHKIKKGLIDAFSIRYD